MMGYKLLLCVIPSIYNKTALNIPSFIASSKLISQQAFAYTPIFSKRNFSITSIFQNAVEAEERVSLKDRTKIIPLETCIRYLHSKAFKETYGDDPVWKNYRRNFKGQLPPSKTRKTCIRGGMLSTGNPCPVCRDEYLVIDYRNVELLKHFISPLTGNIISYTGGMLSTGNPCPVCRDEYLVIDYRNVELLKHFISPLTGNIISYTVTGVCQKQHEKLLIALIKAKERGIYVFDLPFRYYDYNEFYKFEK